MNEMRKLIEAIEQAQLSEDTRLIPFALYSSEDGRGRFPGLQYAAGKIVSVPDTGSYQKNKKAALQNGIKSGIIASKNEIGFWDAYQIEQEEINALQTVLQEIAEVI